MEKGKVKWGEHEGIRSRWCGRLEQVKEGRVADQRRLVKGQEGVIVCTD